MNQKNITDKLAEALRVFLECYESTRDHGGGWPKYVPDDARATLAEYDKQRQALIPSQAGAVAAPLPCPFDCGAKRPPVVHRHNFVGGWTVYCPYCEASTTEMADEAGAIAVWNRRSAAVPIVEALEGLVERWRAIAHELRYNPAAMPRTAHHYETCADELTQLIKERSNG